MGHRNNNMGVIGHNNINKGYNYNSNGVITSIIGTQQPTNTNYTYEEILYNLVKSA